MGQILPGITETVPLQPTGRALIGWMTENEATLWLSGRRSDLQNRDEYRQKAQLARSAVSARPSGIDQANTTGPVPPELDAHIKALHQDSAAVQFFNEGWQVSIVDLSKVCAAQPHVNTTLSTQRVDGLQADDLKSLAALSLPIATPTAFPASFDHAKNAWIFSSANPNLRIGGTFNGQSQPGQPMFGFVVTISTSFLSVAMYQGRYLLRDGYHRAFGLLSKGISRVPAFVREVATYEELAFPAGMLPQVAFLGERPPILLDYSDENVSAQVQAPPTQKMVLIQALEFNIPG